MAEGGAAAYRRRGGKPGFGQFQGAQHVHFLFSVLNLSRAAVAGGAYIVFAKAKTFGVHTDMYTVTVPPGDLGYRIILNWVKG